MNRSLHISASNIKQRINLYFKDIDGLSIGLKDSSNYSGSVLQKPSPQDSLSKPNSSFLPHNSEESAKENDD